MQSVNATNQTAAPTVYVPPNLEVPLPSRADFWFLGDLSNMFHNWLFWLFFIVFLIGLYLWLRRRRERENRDQYRRYR